VLPWISLLRLVIILTAATFIVPLIIKPTRKNVLALLGTTAIAVGIAIKDYVICLLQDLSSCLNGPTASATGYRSVKPTAKLFISVCARCWSGPSTPMTSPFRTARSGPGNSPTPPAARMTCSASLNSTSIPSTEHDNALVRQALFDVAMTSAYLRLDRPIVVVGSHEVPAV
jgi:hypothetical protein